VTGPPPRPGRYVPYDDGAPPSVWREYCRVSDEYWEDVAERLSRLVPVLKVPCWKRVEGVGAIAIDGQRVHDGRLYSPSQKNLMYVGGGDVIQVEYEDRSYAWLGGAMKEDDFDGPYAFGPADLVGGYRYRNDEGDDGSVFTERTMVDVEDPEDPDSVARALAAAARKLGTLDFTDGC
jgi:hypothetical protein